MSNDRKRKRKYDNDDDSAKKYIATKKKDNQVINHFEIARNIEIELYTLPEEPEIGSVIRSLIRHIVGNNTTFTINYQLFFALSPNALQILNDDIVTMIITHGMIGVQLKINGASMELIDNLQDKTLYDNGFSFLSSTPDKTYKTFFGPQCMPKNGRPNPFRGICSQYVSQMLQLRASRNNMNSGMIGSTKSRISISSEAELFKIAKSLTESTELDNEWEEHNTQNAISANPQRQLNEENDPAQKQYRKIIDMIMKNIYQRVHDSLSDTITVYDSKDGIVEISYDNKATIETPPGVKISTLPPVSTGVASAHLIAERVRNEFSTEFNLAQDMTDIIQFARNNVTAIFNDIVDELLNPENLGRQYLDAISAEYHALKNNINKEDIKDAQYPLFNSFFELPISEIIKTESIPAILEHFKQIYFEMEDIVNAEIERYHARDENAPVISIVWSDIGKKNTMNIKLDASKESRKSVDGDA